MRRERAKKGDLVIELTNRDLEYRLVARKGVVAEPIMDRVHERIATLQYWVALIGQDAWPIPDIPPPAPHSEGGPP